MLEGGKTLRKSESIPGLNLDMDELNASSFIKISFKRSLIIKGNNMALD